MDCFFCISALLIAKRDRVKALPMIREADTIFSGTAVCREHIHVPEAEPETVPQRRAGLVVPQSRLVVP